MGPLYHGRFKTLPVEIDQHLEILLRYVERNPVRANLARRAGQWQWSFDITGKVKSRSST